MAKFNVGDKVRILDGKKLGLPWKPNMDSEIGKESIIVQIEEDISRYETFYYLEEYKTYLEFFLLYLYYPNSYFHSS